MAWLPLATARTVQHISLFSDDEIAALAKERDSAAVVRWQSSKARSSPQWVAMIDHFVERSTDRLLRDHMLPGALRGRNVLCVGARAGGEVRAFRSLGAFAVGIDLYPAERGNATLVLRGSAHALQFADASVDVLFTNVMDHIPDLSAFTAEVARVLKPNGILLAEVLGQTRLQDEWAFRGARASHARRVSLRTRLHSRHVVNCALCRVCVCVCSRVSDTGTRAFYKLLGRKLAHAHMALCYLQYGPQRDEWLDRVRTSPSSLRGTPMYTRDLAVWVKAGGGAKVGFVENTTTASCPADLWSNRT